MGAYIGSVMGVIKRDTTSRSVDYGTDACGLSWMSFKTQHACRQVTAICPCSARPHVHHRAAG